MSRRKIKDPTRSRKPRGGPIISGRMIEQSALMARRLKNREDDANIVGDLIAEDKLDPYKINDYKYLSGIARPLGWSVGRVQRALETAGVAKKVRKEKNEQKSVHSGGTGKHESNKSPSAGDTAQAEREKTNESQDSKTREENQKDKEDRQAQD